MFVVEANNNTLRDQDLPAVVAEAVIAEAVIDAMSHDRRPSGVVLSVHGVRWCRVRDNSGRVGYRHLSYVYQQTCIGHC